MFELKLGYWSLLASIDPFYLGNHKIQIKICWENARMKKLKMEDLIKLKMVVKI